MIEQKYRAFGSDLCGHEPSLPALSVDAALLWNKRRLCFLLIRPANTDIEAGFFADVPGRARRLPGGSPKSLRPERLAQPRRPILANN